MNEDAEENAKGSLNVPQAAGAFIQQLMLMQLANPDKENRFRVIREISELLRAGRIYEYPLFAEHLANALDAIAQGKSADSALMPVPRKRPKTGEAYMDRVAISEVVRFYYLQGHQLRSSKDKVGAYELAQKHLEAAGTFKAESTIQAAYLEQLEILKRCEKRVRDGKESPPWWMRPDAQVR
ncbi:hypothetical protein ACRS3X_03565 [Ectopseudomonas hydrolytica]|uniref:hypothetical protein n=1 Tax=Ectopseudomonas hydrolytica TaxID=2493633 RepID=UPI003EDF5142